MTLIDFLRAQLDTDERVALACPTGPWVWEDKEDAELLSHTVRWWPTSPYGPAEGYPTTVLGSCGAHGAESWLSMEDGVAEHIAAWDPARVLAEVKAKRAILAACEASYRESDDYPGWEGAVYAIAQPYAERPGWRPEWSVGE